MKYLPNLVVASLATLLLASCGNGDSTVSMANCKNYWSFSKCM